MDYRNSNGKPVVSTFTITVQKKPPAQLVTFEPLSSWSKGKDQEAYFTTSEGFSRDPKDFIGVFPANFEDLGECFTEILAPRHGLKNGDGTLRFKVLFEEKQLRKLRSRRYTLLYYCQVRSHIIGYSNEFELLEPECATFSEDRQVCSGKAVMDSPHSRASGPLPDLNLESDECHTRVQPLQATEEEESKVASTATPSKVSTDDLGKSSPEEQAFTPGDQQGNSSNFLNANRHVRDKCQADKELESKSKQKKEDPMPLTEVMQEERDPIEKNLQDLSEDLLLEKEKPKWEEEDKKYDVKKEVELLVEEDLMAKNKSCTLGDPWPESVRDATTDVAVLSHEDPVEDTDKVPLSSEVLTERERPTRTTSFQAPSEGHSSLKKTEL